MACCFVGGLPLQLPSRIADVFEGRSVLSTAVVVFINVGIVTSGLGEFVVVVKRLGDFAVGVENSDGEATDPSTGQMTVAFKDDLRIV